MDVDEAREDRSRADRFLALSLALLTLSIGALAATAYGAGYVLSGVRAYVGGEGLWSKGEKDAVLHLTHYVLTGSESDDRLFRAALAVPLGDRQARLELERPRFDSRVVDEGLAAGRVHPDDRPPIVWLFRHFRGVGAFDHAIRIWRRGDDHILMLESLAARARAERRGGPLAAGRQRQLLAAIDDLNRAVTALEDDFSFTLGELARRVRLLMTILVLGCAALLLSGAVAVSWHIAGRLRREEEAQRQSAQVIRYQAHYDALTGLVNRTVFLDRLRRAVDSAHRRVGELAVFFLDIDHFKMVNDSLGHAAGDQLLQRIAHRLRHGLREGDLVGRMGGDEFTILLQSCTHLDGVPQVAQKLLDMVAMPVGLEGTALRVSASIGIGIFPDDGPDAEALLRNADLALYRAKEEGRGRFVLCTPALKLAAAAAAWQGVCSSEGHGTPAAARAASSWRTTSRFARAKTGR